MPSPTPSPAPASEIDEPTRGAQPLTVGAELAASTSSAGWAALIAPLAVAAVVLALIAAGFATRRKLARVD